MAEIELNLDPFLKIRELLGIDLINPASFIPLSQLAGIEYFGLTLGDQGSANFNDLEMVRNITDAHLTIRIPADSEYVGNILAYHPYTVIFTHPTSTHGCLDLMESNPELEEYVTEILEDESCAVGVRIKPELEHLKKAYKLGVDTVEFECSEFSEETSARKRKHLKEKLARLTSLCYKHDLEVSLTGKFSYVEVEELSLMEQVGIISVGRSVAAKALLLGIREAVHDLLT